MIQEVTAGTSQVFSSFFDGINNTMKVSMLMIGICFVSMLGHWLQVVAYSWWVSKHQGANTALAIVDGAEALPSLRPTSLDGTVLSSREVSATLSEPLCGQGKTSSSPVDSIEGVPDAPEVDSLPTRSSTEIMETGPEASSRVFPQTGPGGPSTGKIARLKLEDIVRCIWLRDNDGTSFRRGWFEEIDKLLVPGTVREIRSAGGGPGYEQYAFFVNAANEASKRRFTVRMSSAIEDVSRSTNLGKVALRNLIECSCEQYDQCHLCVPGDLTQEWPEIWRDTLCKHCIVVLILKLIAQTSPGRDYRDSMSSWKKDRKNWPLTPGERGLGDESRDVYSTGEGLKIGPRANFSTDLYRIQGSKPKTIYISTDPNEWMRQLPFPRESEMSQVMACFYAMKLKANMGRRVGGSTWFETQWFESQLRSALATGNHSVPNDPLGDPSMGPKKLLRDPSTGLVESAKYNDERRNPAWIQGDYGGVSLRGYKAVDNMEEVISGIECDANTAALIGREQALAEREAVILCCCAEEVTTRGTDMIVTMLMLLERKVRMVVVMNQEMIRKKTDLTGFLIGLKEAKTATVMITPERFQSQILCLGLKVRVTTDQLLEDIDRMGKEKYGYSRPPIPSPLFRDRISLDGQTHAAEQGVSIGNVSVSKGLPGSLVSWFDRIMVRSLPLEDWMAIVDDRRDPEVDYRQRHSLSLARTRS